MTPLTERIGHLQLLRVAMGFVVLTVGVLDPGQLGTSVYDAIVPTAGFLVITAVVEVARRVLKRAIVVMGIALLVDGLYLGWVVVLTGGSGSPFRFLLYVHLIAVTLLASYRNGLKIALWHSLIFFLGYYGRAAGVVDVAGAGDMGVERGAVFDVVAFWLVAIATATFSAVNERELRRRKVDLEALAEMGTELEHVSTRTEVASTLLGSVCSSFSFKRALVLGAPDGTELIAAIGIDGQRSAHGFAGDQVIRQAWSGRAIRLIQRLDPRKDPALVAVMPEARNLLVASLSAEGSVVGVLVVEYGGRFGARIERRVVMMVERFAAHAALALRNASLLEQIQIIAATDPLTGVANRRTFEEALEREIARSCRSGENLALVMLDIDHFKSFNDTHGHQGGDDALRQGAQALVAASREFDTVARYGGEEFAIVLPSCSRDEAVHAAERLRRSISTISGPTHITASAGVAVFPDHGADADGLVRAADRALYAAKIGGRDRLDVARGDDLPWPVEGAARKPVSPVGVLSQLGRQLRGAATQDEIMQTAADALWRLVGRSLRARVVVLGGAPDDVCVVARRPGPKSGELGRLDVASRPELVRTFIGSETPGQMKFDADSLGALLGSSAEGGSIDAAVAPVVVQERWTGAILLTSDGPPPGEVIEAMTSIATQVSVALERIELGRAVKASERRSSFVEEQLGKRSLLDPLTNLPNRMLFTEHVKRGLRRRRRSGRPLSVLVLDLDDFKSINDSYGHSFGDRLLVDVAERLGSALRPSDSLARVDGDEFAVLIEDDGDREAALTVSQRLLDSLERPFAIAGRTVSVRASGGIAFTDTPEQGAGELMRDAEVAMRIAKSGNTERCIVFEPRMHTALLERLELKADLQGAMERGELIIHYQPIVRLNDNSLDAVEALIRWDDPQRGVLSPAHFIALAEDTGLIVPFGRWVLNEACRQTRAWQRDHPTAAGMKVSVNLSVRQLQDPSLVGDVAHALESSGLDARSLVLEITENAVMADHETATRRIRELKRLGVQIAVDDFGTGYSSLGYLRRFDLDVLKVDRYFIEGISLASEEAALVRTIIELGKTLGMEVVAEGVEVADQLTELRALGCDLAQGYLISRPLDPAAAEAWIAGRAREGAVPPVPGLGVVPAHAPG